MVLFEGPDCKIGVVVPNPLICLIAGHSILRGNKQYEATNTKNGPNAAGCRLRPVSYTHLTLPTTPYV